MVGKKRWLCTLANKRGSEAKLEPKGYTDDDDDDDNDDDDDDDDIMRTTTMTMITVMMMMTMMMMTMMRTFLFISVCLLCRIVFLSAPRISR